MAVDTLSIVGRLERSGVPSPHARAIAAEFGGLQQATPSELVTREDLDLALARLRAEVKPHAGALRFDLERLLREQTNKLIVRLGTIIVLGIAAVGGLGVMF